MIVTEDENMFLTFINYEMWKQEDYNTISPYAIQGHLFWSF